MEDFIKTILVVVGVIVTALAILKFVRKCSPYQ